ncbi:hypothetical protein IMY05_C4507000300 [Salix suchowensis]|nr:hypothetical protein IMY05_C4507000300 [Salix suchowensis]
MSAESIDGYLRIGRDGQQGRGSVLSLSSSPEGSCSTNRSTCSERRTTSSPDSSLNSFSTDVFDPDVGLAWGSEQAHVSYACTAFDAAEIPHCPGQNAPIAGRAGCLGFRYLNHGLITLAKFMQVVGVYAVSPLVVIHDHDRYAHTYSPVLLRARCVRRPLYTTQQLPFVLCRHH